MRFGFCARWIALGLLLIMGFFLQSCAGDSSRLTLTDVKISMQEPAHIVGSARNLSDGGNASVSALYEARAHGSIHPYSLNNDSINAKFRTSDGVFGGSIDYAHKGEYITVFLGGGLRAFSGFGYFGLGANTDYFELGSALRLDFVQTKISYAGYTEHDTYDFSFDGGVGDKTTVRDSFETNKTHLVECDGISFFASGFWNNFALSYALTVLTSGSIGTITYSGNTYEINIGLPTFLIHDLGVSYTYDKKIQVGLGASRYSIFGTGGQIYSVNGRVAYLW